MAAQQRRSEGSDNHHYERIFQKMREIVPQMNCPFMIQTLKIIYLNP